MQSIMWKEFTPEGQLKWQFMDSVTKMMPFYIARAVGGTLFLVGALMMVYNLIKTIGVGSFVANEDAEAPALKGEYHGHGKDHWHRWIERKPVQMMIVSLVVVLIGGIVEFIPAFLVKSNIPTISSVKPYTPLELQGRDIYIREGCYTCHSQMVRPFRSEVMRYAPDPGSGGYSKAGEFVYDHPFQWGSKRTGPDLARESSINPSAAWHFLHMYDPRQVSDKSIMPAYPWLYEDKIDAASTVGKIKVMQKLGVPYPAGYENIALKDMEAEATAIANELNADQKVQQFIKMLGSGDIKDKEIVALIAYLKKLGRDIKSAPKEEVANLSN